MGNRWPIIICSVSLFLSSLVWMVRMSIRYTGQGYMLGHRTEEKRKFDGCGEGVVFKLGCMAAPDWKKRLNFGIAQSYIYWKPDYPAM